MNSIAEDYLKRQNRWVATHGLRTGDFVMVCRVPEVHEMAQWTPAWIDRYMLPGYVRQVEAVLETAILLDDNFLYPYFVLEVVVGRRQTNEPIE